MMPASDQDRARRSLLYLRGEFEHEARRDPDLTSVLLCASRFDHPRASELPPVPWLDEEPSFKRAWCGPDDTLLLFYYYGQAGRQAGKFASLAVHAARAWAALARSGRVRPQESTNLGSGVDWTYEDLPDRFGSLQDDPNTPLWLLVVHSLAWKRLPGSPLVGERQVWDRDWPVFGHFALPYELERRRETIETMTPPLAEALRNQPVPDFYCSALPCDVFRASIFAIDLLLEADTLERSEQSSRRDTNSDRFSVRETECTSEALDRLGRESVGALHRVSVGSTSESRPRDNLTGQIPAPRRRIPFKEAVILVDIFLSGNHGATVEEVNLGTGVSAGNIIKTPAWKADELYRQKSGRRIRTRNTKSGTPGLSKSRNVSEGIDFSEAVEPLFLKRATKDQRTRYRRSPREERSDLLKEFLIEEIDRICSSANAPDKIEIRSSLESMIRHQNYELIVAYMSQIADRFEEDAGERSPWKS